MSIYSLTLPENAQISSVSGFTECQTTGTRQICDLPSARQWALSKDVAHGMPKRYRVPAVGKESHSARLCRVPAGEHSAKTAHVPSTRARRAMAVKVADDR